MKNTQETLNYLQQEFIYNKRNSRYWSSLAIQEEDKRHWKKANQFDAFASMYSERADSYAHTYAFIKEIDWVDAYKELFEAFLNYENERESK